MKETIKKIRRTDFIEATRNTTLYKMSRTILKLAGLTCFLYLIDINILSEVILSSVQRRILSGIGILAVFILTLEELNLWYLSFGEEEDNEVET